MEVIISLTNWLHIEPSFLFTAVDDFHIFVAFVIRF